MRELNVPEIEEEVFLPEAVWTTRTLGKPIISAEAFTFLSGHPIEAWSWTATGSRMRVRCLIRNNQWETNLANASDGMQNAHFARGINRIQMHSFGYSPLGLPPPGWLIYAEVHLESQRAVVVLHARVHRMGCPGLNGCFRPGVR